MVIHFICRGNAFRSLIAEAYLKSLEIKGLEVRSSGTVAIEYKLKNKETFKNTLKILRRHKIEKFAKSHYGDQVEQNKIAGNDIIVCLNQIAFDECNRLVDLPAHTLIWNITDIGEKGRIPRTEKESETFREDVYREIVNNVDELVSKEISRSRFRLD